jgi:AcrR family transcriptional regulator
MTNEAQDDEASKGGQAEKSADPRTRIIDALMRLAAERTFEEISIREICAAADVTLADFRDAFPSKGAVLGGLSKRIDRAVLSHSADELAAEAPRERLFDVLMRRLDAMAPYRGGLREISAWLRRDPAAALAMNQVTVNSMRFMLEAAGIDSDGAAGALKLQGLALAWARIVAIWLDDSEPGLSRTMAALDRELTSGQRMVAGIDQLDRLAAPLKAIARAAVESGSRVRGGFRKRPSQTHSGEDVQTL